MAWFVLRRVVLGCGVVVATAFFAYGGDRALRHESPQYAGVGWWMGTWHDLERLFGHFDAGVAGLPGTPAIRDLFARGWEADLWLLAGAVSFGVLAGTVLGSYCVRHPGTLRTRAIEAFAMVGLCAPPFVLGYGLLLLFHPTFGAFEAPLFFEVHVYEPPYVDPWAFLQGLLVPCFVAGMPVAAVVLRLSRSAMTEAIDEDYIRTAIAKGVPFRHVVGRHARPASQPTVFSFVGTSSALIVLNVLITESVFSVPGFLVHTRQAFGQGPEPATDYAVLQAEAVWGAVLIVALGIVADLLLASRDPRARA